MVVMDMAVAEMAATASTAESGLQALQWVAAPPVAAPVLAELEDLTDLLWAERGGKVPALVHHAPVTLAEDQVETA